MPKTPDHLEIENNDFMNLPEIEDTGAEEISNFFDQDISLEDMAVTYPSLPPSQEANRVILPEAAFPEHQPDSQGPTYNNSQGSAYSNSQESCVSTGHIDGILDHMESSEGLADLARVSASFMSNERWPSSDEEQSQPDNRPGRPTQRFSTPASQPTPNSQPSSQALVPVANSQALVPVANSQPPTPVPAAYQVWALFYWADFFNILASERQMSIPYRLYTV